VGGVEGLIKADLVFLVDLVAGMGEGEGEFAIIGDYEKAFAVFVEAPDMEDTRPILRDKIENSAAVAFVARRAEEPLRFVQYGSDAEFGVENSLAGFDNVTGLDLSGEV
jgi:hypothetical protein